jgi:hypothetical protein
MTCSVPDCGKKVQADNLCPKHYQRRRRARKKSIEKGYTDAQHRKTATECREQGDILAERQKERRPIVYA